MIVTGFTLLSWRFNLYKQEVLRLLQWAKGCFNLYVYISYINSPYGHLLRFHPGLMITSSLEASLVFPCVSFTPRSRSKVQLMWECKLCVRRAPGKSDCGNQEWGLDHMAGVRFGGIGLSLLTQTQTHTSTTCWGTIHTHTVLKTTNTSYTCGDF